LAQNSAAFETRTLINDRSNALFQSVNQSYATLLLEQQKVKECLGKEQADAKYESLKNKEHLSQQMAMGFADNKFEALKNTHALSSQIEQCCCGIKGKISEVSTKLDDTIRTLDSTRLRDSLNSANNEINLLKAIEHTRHSYGGGGIYGFGNGLH
jgi:uncharacterized protein YpuA (DUF1002 family)